MDRNVLGWDGKCFERDRLHAFTVCGWIWQSVVGGEASNLLHVIPTRREFMLDGLSPNAALALCLLAAEASLLVPAERFTWHS